MKFNSRLLILVLGVVGLLYPSASFAQINVEAKYEVGELIKGSLVVDPPTNATATYNWTYSEGVQLEPVEGGRKFYAAAKPGKHTIEVDATYTLKIPVIDPEDPTKWTPGELPLPPYHYEVEFEVEGAVIPTPDPDPDPTPVAGTKQVVIIHETADDSQDFNRLETGLRVAPASTYFSDKKHPIPLIFDDNDIPESVKSKLPNLPTLPAVFVIDVASKTVQVAETLPSTATAQTVIDIVKRAGG